MRIYCKEQCSAEDLDITQPTSIATGISGELTYNKLPYIVTAYYSEERDG